ALEKVTRLRRYSGDWRLLGMCYLEQNRLPQALEALRQALVIRPWRPDVHLGLARVYQRLGDSERANEHTAQAPLLMKKEQKENGGKTHAEPQPSGGRLVHLRST